MAVVNIDGRDYELTAGDNLLQAVLSEALELPYFCWHPAMGSVGSCRLCAVIEYADENDERGRLQMACMMPVRDGMRVSLSADFASNFREQVIEWLMENHPHDCPVCEEGGECHLQDMTVMTGHSMREYRGQKRTWENQDLGPFIGHEMNRCITCYRCVRYYRDYAGGKDLDAFGSRARMYFGREEEGTLESEFAGNLVEVCPTGVFTDKPFAKHYTRKWDLQSAPSVCPGCSVGCNTIASERYGVLKRVHNRYHGEINRYFLCDRGRFGIHYVNNDSRIRVSGVRADDGAFEARGRDHALEQAAAALGSGPIVGIGSPRASIEANYALKTLVGAENFSIGVNAAEAQALDTAIDVYRTGGFKLPTVTDMESADAVLILGEDVSNTAARLALSIRQTVRSVSFDMADAAGIPQWQDAGVRGHGQHAKSPVFIATPASTRLDDIATARVSGDADAIAATGFAIANAIDGGFAEGTASDFTAQVAEALKGAKNPLIVSGTALASAAVVQAAANIAWALGGGEAEPMLAFVGQEANSFGAALLGGDLALEEAVERAKGSAAIVLENDLHRRLPAEQIALGNAIVVDSLEHATAEQAKVVMPAATFAEQTGTFVNFETRAQRFYQVFEPTDEIAPSWRWLVALADTLGRDDLAYEHIDELTGAAATAAGLAGVEAVAPSADFRVEANAKIPRQSHRYSGRTAMRANISVHEPKATIDEETPLAYSMEGQNQGKQPGSVVPYFWTPGWNSNQSVFKFQQEISGHLNGGDPGVRLIEGGDGAGTADRYRELPTPTAGDGLTAIPLHDVFASGELTAQSAPVLDRAPAPYAVLNPADAQTLGVDDGDGIAVDALGLSLEVKIDANAAPGGVSLAQGWPGVAPLAAARVTASKDSTFVRRSHADPNMITKG